MFLFLFFHQNKIKIHGETFLRRKPFYFFFSRSVVIIFNDLSQRYFSKPPNAEEVFKWTLTQPSFLANKDINAVVDSIEILLTKK